MDFMVFHVWCCCHCGVSFAVIVNNFNNPQRSPVVRLESFTRGGFGPSHSIPTHGNDHYDNNKSSYSYDSSTRPSIPRRLLNSVIVCCYHCNNGSKSPSDDEHYYTDDFNDLSWNCSIGTSDEDGIWMNRSDFAGTIMAVLVWLLIVYSALTITFLAQTGGIPVILSMVYCILASLALASHAKTTLTDPGSVPSCAVPTAHQRNKIGIIKLSMCSQCQTFKPPMSHHCRICNRCISRMDHHCPWMNNCVGGGNMKHFILFLIYTWTCSAFSLLLLGWNYFFCATEDCTFTIVLVQLVRIMTLLSIGAFLFTSSMLMNVCYGLMTGIGTIDRLKKKATNLMHEAEDEPIPLKDVFGIGSYFTWPLPVDPVFQDYDRIMGFSTPQRLLREQMLQQQSQSHVVSSSSLQNGVGGATTNYKDYHHPGSSAGGSGHEGTDIAESVVSLI